MNFYDVSHFVCGNMSTLALQLNVTFLTNITNMTVVENSGNGSTLLVTAMPSDSLQMTRFIVQKILVPIIVTCGVVGNMFNIIVLANPKMRTSTNIYLVALAFSDCLYLLFSFSLSFLHCSNKHQRASAFYYIPYGRAITDLFANNAVWLTVCFTMERYIGVCHPMKGKAWCTVGKAKLAAILTFLFCIINTIPEVFETKIIERKDSAGYSTMNYECIYTELAESESYQIGYYWWYVSIFTFMPLILLSIFNSLLIRSVWEANKARNVLSNVTALGEHHRQTLEQQKVTMMLIAVVIIFMSCQLPNAVLHIYKSYLDASGVAYPVDMLRIAGNISNLLVQINASVNFLLYSYFISRFRKTFRKVVCKFYKRRPWRQNTLLLSSTLQKSTYTTRTTLTSNPACRQRKPRNGFYTTIRLTEDKGERI